LEYRGDLQVEDRVHALRPRQLKQQPSGPEEMKTIKAVVIVHRQG
jgi:hypothetical protein